MTWHNYELHILVLMYYKNIEYYGPQTQVHIMHGYGVHYNQRVKDVAI